MELRRAGPGDARAIAEVHVRSWKAAFGGLLPQDYLDALAPEDRLGQWRQALSSPRWPVVVVAEEAGRIVGFAAVAPSADADADPEVIGEVQTIYLDAGAWGSGRGAALLEAALAELVAGGFSEATLWVLHSNARARRFYERQGWSADGATKEHDWGAFVATDVRYARRLASPRSSASERPPAGTPSGMPWPPARPLGRAGRLVLRALRLPAVLDRRGLRWALRLVSPLPVMVLAHRGRRTGRLYRTPLETFSRNEAGEVLVAPLLGERADWFRNLVAGGPVEGVVDGRHTALAWRRVPVEEAAAALEGYRRAHRLYSRVVLSLLARVNGLDSASSKDVAAVVPVVALRADP